jgi:tetratricopeptide (TPR) repeat protein
MNMKKFDQSAEYYKKAIEADPSDPEAYYSVGVIDWTAAYKDISDRKSKLGLGVEAPIKSKEVCEQIKAADGPRIDEGLKMLQTAMEKRQDYDDAMTYTNLLYHRKADTECGDQQAYANDIKLANDWSDKAMAARKKKFEEASKKTQGGIVLDQPKK